MNKKLWEASLSIKKKSNLYKFEKFISKKFNYKANKNYNKGINIIKIKDKKRYDEPFEIFLDRLKKNNNPEFNINHELLVQESLMRAING